MTGGYSGSGPSHASSNSKNMYGALNGNSSASAGGGAAKPKAGYARLPTDGLTKRAVSGSSGTGIGMPIPPPSLNLPITAPPGRTTYAAGLKSSYP